MTSLLHVIDTDSLQKDPNLKFDPQNASAFLTKDHPNYQELIQGLTPEQIEIIENTTQVDGYEKRDETEQLLDGDEEFIDPDTGEKIKINDGDLTLDDLGFIDPSKLRSITFEAFYNPYDHHIRTSLQSASAELMGIKRKLKETGLVSKELANSVNAALGGTLYSNIVMESFTSQPTKNNYKLVMEEIDKGQAALAAGGAIIGATIIYKLIRWFLNSWNKNAVAAGTISGNIKNIQERKDRLRNADNIIDTANNAINAALNDLKNDNDVKNNELKSFLQKYQGGKLNDNAQAMKVLADIDFYTGVKALRPVYSNLWLSISTKGSVNVAGGSFIAGKPFFEAIPLVINACKQVQNTFNSQVENIRTTGADKAIQDKDKEYAAALDAFKSFGKMCGYTQDSQNIADYATSLMNHILNNITKPLGESTVIQKIPDAEALSVIDPNAWSTVDDEYTKEVEEFYKNITDLNGTDEVKGGFFSKGQAAQPNAIKQGQGAQLDSRIAEYEKITQAFRATMLLMRAILSIRNNVGRGLQNLDNQGKKLFG